MLSGEIDKINLAVGLNEGPIARGRHEDLIRRPIFAKDGSLQVTPKIAAIKTDRNKPNP
jgi:hypothetical protein